MISNVESRVGLSRQMVCVFSCNDKFHQSDKCTKAQKRIVDFLVKLTWRRKQRPESHSNQARFRYLGLKRKLDRYVESYHVNLLLNQS